MMRTSLVTPPDDEPLSIAQARMHLRNPEITSNDAEIQRFIQSARENAENKTGRKLLTQTWDLYFDRFPVSCGWRIERCSDYGIELPWTPLQSITSITYLDTNNVSQTLAGSAYAIDATGLMPRIRPVYGTVWPDTLIDWQNAVTIRAMFGYTDVEFVPESIKHWMLLFIEAADKNRGLLQEREPFLTPFAERLLDASRIITF